MKVSVTGPRVVAGAPSHVRAGGRRDIARHGRLERRWTLDAQSAHHATEEFFSGAIAAEETSGDRRAAREGRADDVRPFPRVGQAA